MATTPSASRRQRRINQVLVGLAVVTVVLGMIGYARVGLAPGEGGNAAGFVGRVLDLFYVSLQLLWLGGKDVKGDPVLLWARWFGALFAFAVIVRLLVPHLDERIARWRTRRWSGHRVVIGLGDKGLTLTRLAAGDDAPDLQRQVVALDVDEGKVDDRLLLRRGLQLLRGDGRSDDVRRDAAVVDAESVVVVTESETKNIEIARLVAADAVTRRQQPQPLRVFAHVADPALRRESFAGASQQRKALLRPFALTSAAARLLLAEHPLPVLARENGALRVNVVFVGFDAYAEELLLHIVRLGPLDGQQAPRITVFAPGAGALQARLQRDVPALFALAERLRFEEFDPLREPARDDLALAEEAGAPVTACFVQATGDGAALALALRVRRAAQRHGHWKAPVFVRLSDAAPFVDLLDTQFRGGKVPEEKIVPYGELARTLAAAVDTEWRELLAQQLHVEYRADQREAVAGVRRFPVTPTEIAWCALSEELRESNRRAVEHFPLKLASAGRVLRGDMPVLDGPLQFDDATVERLARLEHGAWSHEKLLAGWRLGVPRDDLRRLHTDLVPFEQLGDARRKDVSQIRKLEKQLLGPGDPQLARLLDEARRTQGPSVFRERVIGLAGHIVLSRDEAKNLAGRVESVLQQRMEVHARLATTTRGPAAADAPRGDEFWTFVTPLAPGGDFALADAVLDWLERQPHLNAPRRRYRMLVVQDLPLAVLVQMWREAGGFERGTPDGSRAGTHRDFAADHPSARDKLLVGMLRDFMRDRPAVERFVDLSAPGSLPPDYASSEARHAALERTNRYLLTHCDDLIAAFDPRRYGFDTFTAQRWRAARAGEFKVAGLGALVHAWLQPRTLGRDSAVQPLGADAGLHWIDITQPSTPQDGHAAVGAAPATPAATTAA
jgi:hypothetical protein